MNGVRPLGPDTPIRFGGDGAWRVFAGAGWAVHDDPGLTWTDGSVARLRFRLNGVRRDAMLSCRITPFVAPGTRPFQDAFIYLNGLCMTYVHVSETMTVAFDVLREQFSTGINHLMFAMPHAVIPAEIGIGTDSRRLGLAFHRLDLVFTD